MTDVSVRRAVLLVATLGAFLTPFMASSINVALPTIGAEFGMDAVLLSWVPMAYSLAAAMFLLPFGKLADIHGRKRTFAIGIALYGFASALCAMAPSGGLLVFLRALQGTGGAMIFGTGTAMLTSAYPPGERGRVLGINVATVYVGLSLGPFLGGILTQNLGWRSLFAINAILGALIIGVVALQLKTEWAEARGEQFDLLGAIIYGLSLAAVMYGLSLLPELAGVGLIAPGLVGMGIFVWWEARARSPLLNLNLFRRSRVFALSNLAALINYSATTAVSFLLSLYLQYVKGLPPQTAGLVLIAQPVIQALFSPSAGHLSDRMESRIVASAGMAVTVVGLGLLALLNSGTSFPFIILCLMLLGFGFALFSSPNTNAVMGAVERRFYGVASATVGTARLTGQMLSLGVAALLLALFVGRVQITPAQHAAFLASVRTTFGIFSLLCLGGVFASLARGNVHEREPSVPSRTGYSD